MKLWFGLMLLPFVAVAQTEVKVIDGSLKGDQFMVSVDVVDKKYHEVIDGRILNCSGDGPIFEFIIDGKPVKVYMKELTIDSLNYQIFQRVCQRKA